MLKGGSVVKMQNRKTLLGFDDQGSSITRILASQPLIDPGKVGYLGPDVGSPRTMRVEGPATIALVNGLLV
jgi:hypothetical protein